MQKKLGSIFGDDHGLDEKSVKFLTSALEKNNLPGFDYIEYKQSLAALSNLDMPEEMAFKSAFATAATVGLTKAKLLKTAIHYKKILDTEKKQFDMALEKQMQQRVGSKITEVAKLKKQIEAFKAKVAELEGKMESSQKIIDSADADIQEAKEKIEGTRESFETTLKSLNNAIDQDINNIEKYI
jgi:predicted RNase H-like nuclease (RuvC/YqgF family)